MSSVKYLGVILDQNLSGNSQAADVLKKASAWLAFLYRKSDLLDFRTRITLCQALMQPFFDYCCSSWFSAVNFNLKGRLGALQRKMVRFVFNFDSRFSVTTHHLRKLGWLSVSDRVRYFKLILAFKIRTGQAPSYLSDSFTNFSSVQYSTKSNRLLGFW